MPTSITFTDAIGAASLTNEKPAPGDRFSGWHPITRPGGGEGVNRQSDQLLVMMRVRDDYMCRFELRGIPSTRTGGVAPTDLADRLIYHLMNGGTCVVNTGDAQANSYATCSLRKGFVPTLTLTDEALLEYTLTLELVNVAGSPARMVCRYAEQ